MERKEYGITFTEKNIRLILARKKCQTRRVVEKIDKYKNLKTGDRLYIQETWKINDTDTMKPKVVYRMDYAAPMFYRWKPSIFMPKRYARFWLEVIRDPWLENIQDISDEDCTREGIGRIGYVIGGHEWTGIKNRRYTFCRDAFIELWDSINAKRGYSYASNPRDRAIEFKLLEEKNENTDKKG